MAKKEIPEAAASDKATKAAASDKAAKAAKDKAPKAKAKPKDDGLPEYLRTFAKAVEKEGEALDMKAVTLNAGERIRWAVPSGSLVSDLICGGGYGVARYSCPFGLEASGKSTSCMEAIAEAMANKVLTVYYDSEGSLDLEYLDRILIKKTGHGLEYFMAIIDENGSVKKAGLFYYIQPVSIEACFTHATRLAESLPDCVKHKDKGWCWQDEDGKLTPREMEGNATAVYIIDSLKALVPQQQVDNDQANQMAMQAAAFSKSFPKLTAVLGRKRIAVIYINQLRMNPNARFGSPEYEPCGEAAKFFSALRIRYATCALSTVDKVFKTGTQVEDAKGVAEEELSWDGKGIDRYRYAKIRTVKNKQFSPFQAAYVRFRYEKCSGQGDGIDPSFDAYLYLYLTGQCSKKTGKGLTISLFGADMDEPFPAKVAARLVKLDELEQAVSDANDGKLETGATFDRKLSWQDFKELVENPVRQNALAKLCKAQMSSGYAWSLYFDNKNGSFGEREEGDEQEDDE